jgi:hypothetical protein
VLAAAAALASAQNAPPALPSWLAAYPGASPQTRSSSVLVESAYETPAPPADVVAHYQKLFGAAGLSANPTLDGIGTVIRGAPPECGLLITIRQRGTATAVRVSCAAKSAAAPMKAVADPPPQAPSQRSTFQERMAQIQQDGRKAREAAEARQEERSRAAIHDMEKYDRPYTPPPKAPPPPPVWPAWLVRTDGGTLPVQKGTDRLGLKTLSAAFLSKASRADIQAFYADLIQSNGYQFWSQTPANWPASRKATVEGRFYPKGDPGPRFVLKVEIGPPAEGTSQIEIRLTSYP